MAPSDISSNQKGPATLKTKPKASGSVHICSQVYLKVHELSCETSPSLHWRHWKSYCGLLTSQYFAPHSHCTYVFSGDLNLASVLTKKPQTKANNQTHEQTPNKQKTPHPEYLDIFYERDFN